MSTFNRIATRQARPQLTSVKNVNSRWQDVFLKLPKRPVSSNGMFVAPCVDFAHIVKNILINVGFGAEKYRVACMVKSKHEQGF